MFKYLSILTVLAALGAGSLGAHEREADLQRINVSNAGFDMVVATAKIPNAVIYDLGETPDALAIHLVGGALWLAFEDADKMLETFDMLQQSVGNFHVERKGINLAVYIVPKIQ